MRNANMMPNTCTAKGCLIEADHHFKLELSLYRTALEHRDKTAAATADGSARRQTDLAANLSQMCFTTFNWDITELSESVSWVKWFADCSAAMLDKRGDLPGDLGESGLMTEELQGC
jgi:hypothetical protein